MQNFDLFNFGIRKSKEIVFKRHYLSVRQTISKTKLQYEVFNYTHYNYTLSLSRLNIDEREGKTINTNTKNIR